MSYADWRSSFDMVIDDRFYTLEWLDSRIEDGSAVFFGNDRAGIVAELRTYPAGAIEVHGLIAAGELQGILALIPLAEDWGRDNGAITAAIESRGGWLKVTDYDVYQICLKKDL